MRERWDPSPAEWGCGAGEEGSICSNTGDQPGRRDRSPLGPLLWTSRLRHRVWRVEGRTLGPGLGGGVGVGSPGAGRCGTGLDPERAGWAREPGPDRQRGSKRLQGSPPAQADRTPGRLPEDPTLSHEPGRQQELLRVTKTRRTNAPFSPKKEAWRPPVSSPPPKDF